MSAVVVAGEAAGRALPVVGGALGAGSAPTADLATAHLRPKPATASAPLGEPTMSAAFIAGEAAGRAVPPVAGALGAGLTPMARLPLAHPQPEPPTAAAPPREPTMGAGEGAERAVPVVAGALGAGSAPTADLATAHLRPKPATASAPLRSRR
ncbi:hypothetical protein ACWGH2_24095 [Streptomyces sp. NPDC054871]